MVLITIEDLALKLAIKKPTLRKWTKPGQEAIPCYRIGKLVRFNLQEVESWLQSKAVQPIERGIYDPKVQKSPIT